MAEDESRAPETTFLPQFDAPTFWRLGRWGLAACAATILAFLVGTSDMGMRRLALAYSNTESAPAAPQPRDSVEVVRLNEAVRKLTIDRDQLRARLDALERNFSDLTGSVALSFTPPRPATPPTATPETAPPSISANTPAIAPAAPSAPQAAASNGPANSPAAAPQSPQVPASESSAPDAAGTAKPDFGLDLGGAPTIDGLRALWNTAKGRHASLLENLRPIVSIREPTRPGGVELRLVVGPIPTAALAARMCVVITATGAACQPAVFDGQRLAMR